MTATEYVHPGVTDPGVSIGEAVAPSGASSHLRDVLLADLKTSTHLENVTYPVRSRPGWEVVYSPVLDADLLKAWTKNIDANDGEFDVALRVLAGQCRGFVRNGQPVVLDGEPLTFASAFMRETFNAIDTITTVRAFYDDDTALGHHYQRLSAAAADGLDPTDPSVI